jgi:predicted GNAT family N-acyltransferase
MTTVTSGFSTQFVTFVRPPGEVLARFPIDGSQPPSDIPEAFVEAFSVRKAVFVDEQHCSIENEIDGDDSRSYHWVAYASVSGPKPGTSARGDARRILEGGKVAIATIRLVPSPHSKHPPDGSVDGIGGKQVKPVEGGPDQATALHDGKEPYVKLGRLATLKHYRGMGLGRLLVNTALDWVVKNKEKALMGPEDPVEREREEALKGKERAEWKGLVMVDAQTDVIKFYESLGFKKDDELGTWIEEGIDHVAMWRRLRIEH